MNNSKPIGDTRLVWSLSIALCLLAPLTPAAAQTPQVPQAGGVPRDSIFAHKSAPALPPGGNGGLYYIWPKGDTPAAEQARAAADQASLDTIRRGEALMKSGDNDGAISAFQQTLAVEPRDGLALQRLAEAYTAKGQADQALATYRRLVYRVPGQKWGSSGAADPTVLMHFALLLQQTGQEAEALAIYHRAVYFLDYDMGRPRLSVPVPIPDLGDGPGQVPYTPQTLEAMAHLVLGIDTPGFDSIELQKAAALAPDSAAVQYYLGKYLVGNDNAAARVALEKAIRLGDEQTAKEAKIYLEMAH